MPAKKDAYFHMFLIDIGSEIDKQFITTLPNNLA